MRFNKTTPTFFAKQSDLRKWFEKNHKKETEILVGFYKLGSGKPSITWSQSVDEAICFGWIDGVRKSIDKYRYCIRFTPRRPTSIWSTINIKKVEELTKRGLMKPVGLASFEKREEKKSRIYAYEKEPVALDKKYEKKFKVNKKAWGFFKSQAPSYQKVLVHWITSAKQEATRINRLEKLISSSETGKRIQ